MSTPPDAVDRETAWLAASGDGLPALLETAGGPFAIIQAYWPRTQRTQQRAVYVTRSDAEDTRYANVRVILRHQFRLKIIWPVLTGTGHAETEQRNLDAAVKLLIQRIRGPLLDKTHGGRFLSVAENPRRVTVTFDDPETTLGAKELRVTVTYMADDPEVNA